MTTNDSEMTAPGGDDDTRDHAHDAAHAARLLRSAIPAPAFRDGFADRTMARIAATRAAASVTVAPIPPAVLRATAIQRNFRVLAAAAALAIVALGVHNTVVARADDASLVEAAIGLQPVSAASVLSYTTDDLQ